MDQIMNYFILLIILFVTLVFYFIIHSRYWSSKGIPSLPPLPLFGNFKDVFLMKINSAVFLKTLYDKANAPALGIFMCNQPCLLLRDPEWIKNILVRDFNYFDNRVVASQEYNDIIGTKSLFSIKNPFWKQLRVKLTPVFTSGKIKSMFHLMNQEGKELNAHINRLQDNKEATCNARELSAKYTTDVIATCAFGIRANCLTNNDAEFRLIGRNIFSASFKRFVEFSSFFFLPKLANLLRLQFFAKEGTQFMRKTFNETVRIREESKLKRLDLVDTLIDLKNLETVPGEIKFEGDILVAQAAEFFTAGFETTSSTISFTLFELAQNPDIQDKLRSEILEKIKESSGISYESIGAMPYLHMVISETLRKYPPLAFLDRVCGSNSDGYRLPAPYDHVVLEPGTPVYIPLLGLHMDPEYFPNPDKFDPERFTEEAKRNRNPYTYLPFGTGPRNCIGERFALLQTKVGLLHILKDYKVHLCADTPRRIKFAAKAFLLASEYDINLKFEMVSTY